MSYMVSVQGGQAPCVEHPTIEEAKAEAERLAGQPKNRNATIYVLEVIAALDPVTSHKWREGNHELR